MESFSLDPFLSAFIWAHYPMTVLLSCFLFAILVLKLYRRLFINPVNNPNPNPINTNPTTQHGKEADDHNEEGEEHEKQMKKITANCTECAICFEPFTADHDDQDEKSTGVLVLRECGHKFHERCLSPWLTIRRFNPTCPKCRCPLKLQHCHHHQMEIARVPGSFPMLPHETTGTAPILTGHSIPIMLPDLITMLPPPWPVSPSSPLPEAVHSQPRLPHQIMVPISLSPPLPTISHPPLLPHHQFASSLQL